MSKFQAAYQWVTRVQLYLISLLTARSLALHFGSLAPLEHLRWYLISGLATLRKRTIAHLVELAIIGASPASSEVVAHEERVVLQVAPICSVAQVLCDGESLRVPSGCQRPHVAAAQTCSHTLVVHSSV